ncbi:hypothetical protein BDP27DRAFT_1366456 [Rhodocollybia butyracea]|uniref:Uncharacterized protein n=1 Tax=Rhodocollybia butyracea TaxID=206335 RepID=A0A9P5U343_9AGAR|nr:hypothetical protein BDP27DRAFT_1366456 [Rhodocollybia butyracea]
MILTCKKRILSLVSALVLFSLCIHAQPVRPTQTKPPPLTSKNGRLFFEYLPLAGDYPSLPMDMSKYVVLNLEQGPIKSKYPDSVFLEPDLEKAMREEGVTILRAPRDLEASKSTDFVKNKFTGNQMMAFKGAFGLFKGSTYISETIPHENVEKIILFPHIKDGGDQIFFVPKNLVQKYDSQ